MNKLIVFYDDWCPHCTRFAVLVKKFDWLGLIKTKKMRELTEENPSLDESLAKNNKKTNDAFSNHDFYLKNLDIEKAQKQMASLEIKKEVKSSSNLANQKPIQILYGFISIYKILLRLPVYWIFFFYTYPFLFLIKILGLGDILYNQVAIHRKIIPLHCEEECQIGYHENKYKT